jgi:hypothetical protein
LSQTQHTGGLLNGAVPEIFISRSDRNEAVTAATTNRCERCEKNTQAALPD